MNPPNPLNRPSLFRRFKLLQPYQSNQSYPLFHRQLPRRPVPGKTEVPSAPRP